MFKELKLKLATRRIERKKNAKAAKKPTPRKSVRAKKSVRKISWARVWNIICWPFRAIRNLCVRIWAWIRSIDLIGLVNITLLFSIIVLFSMLIIDIVKCNRTPDVVVLATPATKTVPAQKKISDTKTIAPAQVSTLPVKRDADRKYATRPVNVVPARPCAATVRQTARTRNTMFGDVIIDSRGAATILHNGDKIRGNLYLQNMRKYTLPCGVHIDGNLFLRDMNMVQFCGDFTVTGNIYVSPKSSFGPLPRTARIGGQVIL